MRAFGIVQTLSTTVLTSGIVLRWMLIYAGTSLAWLVSSLWLILHHDHGAWATVVWYLASGTALVASIGIVLWLSLRRCCGRREQDELQHAALMDNLPDGAVYRLHRDRLGGYRFTYVSRGMEEVLRIPRDVMLADAMSVFALTEPSHIDVVRETNEQSARDLSMVDMELPQRLTDGTGKWIAVRSMPYRTTDGGVYWDGFMMDITRRKEAEEQLRQAAVVFDSTVEGIAIVDTGGVMLSVNPAFCALSGSVEDELVGRSLLERLATAQDRQVVDAMWADLSRAGQWQGEIQNPHTDGRRMPEWLTVSAVYDAEGAVARYVAVFVDISAMKATEARLSHLAHHDPLTDLPNRALLYTQMRRSIDRAKQRGERFAILFLDLDKFKAVNDELGHASGDQLLQQVAARLRGAIRSQDTLARISGDEFVLILEAQANATETDAALVRILDCFASPYSLDGQPRSITASVGVSCFPLDGTDPDTLLRKADLAMYQVKQHGRDGYRLFHASA